MAMTRAIPWPGVANEIEWESDDVDLIAPCDPPFGFVDRIAPPSRPRPGGDLAPTYPLQQHLRRDEPLWPMTGQGERLRTLYVDHGPNALVELSRWDGWRRHPDDYR